MKRKLNEEDVPVEIEADEIKQASPFSEFGLDDRLLRAIAKLDFSTPTPVQSKTIPLALTGKDVIVRSQTGSGKTAAYCFPIIHSILQQKRFNSTEAITALILVPTRELAQQIFKAINSFCIFCSREIRVVNISQKTSMVLQRALLSEVPDIVIATPGSAAENVSSSSLDLDGLTNLVIDEADLVLSYGYEDDLQTISTALPQGVRTSLISATLTADIVTLKGLFCRDPVMIDLHKTAENQSKITQYVVKCAEDEKFLLSYVMFKLKLIKGKCIIFVGDTDRCYRLKLFFEQFGIRSCVLNSDLPVNSRIHVVEEFNKGVYDIIIASDEHEVLGENEDQPTVKGTPEADKVSDREDGSATAEAVEIADTRTISADASQKPLKKKRKRSKNDREFGISRGIDFQNVSCVLNFDFPTSSKSYTHRIGRTARAGKSGMALSFVIPQDQYRKHPSTTFPTTKHDEEILAQVEQDQRQQRQRNGGRSNQTHPSVAQDPDEAGVLQPYHFDKGQIEPFRYRMTSALGAVTRLAVREARTRELRTQLLASDKLARYFDEHPDDLKHLRLDSELRAARIQPHLRHVPDYLMPTKAGPVAAAAAGGVGGGFVGFQKDVVGEKKKDGRKGRGRWQKRGKTGSGGKKGNPLKSFRA